MLITADIPSAPILVTLIMEVIHSSKTSVLITARQCNIPEDGTQHKVNYVTCKRKVIKIPSWGSRRKRDI
jgi:hypothetical protein